MPSNAGWLLVSAASTWHSPGYGAATLCFTGVGGKPGSSPRHLEGSSAAPVRRPPIPYSLVRRDREEVPFQLAVSNRDRERAARNVVSANERNLPYHVLARAEALLESHGHRYMRVRRQSLLKPGDPHHVHCGEHCQQYRRRVESDADGNS